MSSIYAFCAFSISAEYGRNPHESLFVDRFLQPPLIMPPSDESWAAVRESWENLGDDRYKANSNGSVNDPPAHTPRYQGLGYARTSSCTSYPAFLTAQSFLVLLHNVNENGPTELEEHEYRWFERLQPSMMEANPNLPEYARYEPLEWWLNAVADYSKRQLSFPEKDKLVAIAGIARVWNHERRFDYLAGIFRPHLPWALLWHREPNTVDPMHDKQPLGEESFTLGGVPTWSWTTCKFPVKSYPYTVTQFLLNGTVLVDIKSAQVELADKENPYGQVKSGKIELDGYLGCKKEFDKDWTYRVHYDGRFKEDEEAPWHLPVTWNHQAKHPDLFGLLLRNYQGSGLFYRVGYFIVPITVVSQDILEGKFTRSSITYV
ncbi:hypothetical protein BKA59DRAFT_506933 [Fusarium tricinctum]|uniref:Uncharacterized protein n=1 Tax=Fusarium tricinctum TaxID=61284 RepID=A0A8K0S5Z3_9HYPO|nr:hypothetical protein BKA59DRAFT_506933 [Fusarium tricinctum]